LYETWVVNNKKHALFDSLLCLLIMHVCHELYGNTLLKLAVELRCQDVVDFYTNFSEKIPAGVSGKERKGSGLV